MSKNAFWKIFIPIFFLVPAAILPTSCTADNPLTGNQTVIINSDSPISRSAGLSSVIDLATAEAVAVKFSSTIVEEGKVQEAKSVANTVVIDNTEGTPVMYAVNFESDEGFVIVSASKATKPVVAFSNKGNYSSDRFSSRFAQSMLERNSQSITVSFDYPSDSVKTHHSDWAALLPPERPKKTLRHANSSDDYQAVLSRVIEEWYQLGYTAYPVQLWSLGTSNDYTYLQGLDQLLSRMTMPVSWSSDATVADFCYILVRRIDERYPSTNKCTPISTKWHVNAPYNAKVPDGSPLSSEAVVLGQMLHYKNDPSILPHSRSEENPLQDNNEVASYLYDVATKIHTTFGSTYSYAPLTELTNALSNIYNYSFTMPQPSESALISSIDNGSPVIVVGYDKNGKSDAWICSAYEKVIVRTDYFLMAPLGDLETGIFGPFESCAQWNHNGVPNFYFDNSQDDIYLCSFADFKNGDIYTNGLVFFANVFEKPKPNNND